MKIKVFTNEYGKTNDGLKYVKFEYSFHGQYFDSVYLNFF